MKRSVKYILLPISILFASVVTLSSLIYLYESRDKIQKLVRDRFITKLVKKADNHHGMVDHYHGPRYLVNPLRTSKRQIPALYFTNELYTILIRMEFN